MIWLLPVSISLFLCGFTAYWIRVHKQTTYTCKTEHAYMCILLSWGAFVSFIALVAATGCAIRFGIYYP